MSGEVLAFVDNRVGRVRLNRPKQLHALTTAMCAGVIDALEAWRADPAVEAVMIDHVDGRGFCAGGDIRMLAASSAGDGAAARAFFSAEYRMNHRLFSYAKPTVAFMDGVTMGGGVGLAAPCRYRVATENTRWAMPETGIGLFPDVGGGWYLTRLPGRVGQYLALTGHRLDGADCLALDIASHYVPSEKLEEVKGCVAVNPQEAAAIISDFAASTSRAHIRDLRGEIDRLFASDTLEEVFAALEGDGGEWATQQLATLRTKSPQAMKVSLKLLLDGATMPTFEDEMRQEYAVATRVVQRHDFAEGVRALIVDKDNAPRWEPATVEGVTGHSIDQIFAPLDEADAWTPA